jgi:hypothetical protein
VDVISAVVDNIPVMFAILIMNPVMDQIQWLLVTGYWLLVTLIVGVGEIICYQSGQQSL